MVKNNSSNNLIIIFLVVIALVLFFVNIIDFGSYYNLITGKAVDTAWGSANVTITALTQINVSAGTSNGTNITFGTGYVLPGFTYCAISTEEATMRSSGCSSGLVSPDTNFTIENSGNTNLTVNISADTNAVGFLGGTNPLYEFKVAQTAETGCTGTINNNVGGNISYSLNTTTIQICSQLNSIATQDTMQVSINISIPDNSKTGTLSSIITFTGKS